MKEKIIGGCSASVGRNAYLGIFEEGLQSAARGAHRGGRDRAVENRHPRQAIERAVVGGKAWIGATMHVGESMCAVLGHEGVIDRQRLAACAFQARDLPALVIDNEITLRPADRPEFGSPRS